MIVLEFLSSIAVNFLVLLGFVMLCTLLRSWSIASGHKTTSLQTGLFFGSMAFVSMLVPAVTHDGLMFDCRGGVIGAGAFLGGPIAALISLPIPIAYRLLIAGEGLVPGVMELVVPAILGSVCYWWFPKASLRKVSSIVGSSALTGLGANLLIALYVVNVMPVNVAFPSGSAVNTTLIVMGTPFSMLFVVSLILLERQHTSAMSSMAESERRMLHSQKMAAVGQLARKVAHSFANALTGVLGNAQLAKDRPDCTPEVEELIDGVIESGSRVSSLAGELLAFSSSGSERMMKLDPAKCLSGIKEILAKAVGPTLDLKFDVQSGLGKVEVDPDRIEQAMVHLAVNASEAMQGQGTLTISLKNPKLSVYERNQLQEGILDHNRHQGDFALISVTDTGVGIANKDLPRVFEPFFSTKQHGSNAGLGLATVYNIIQQCNGLIDVESCLGKGTSFLIYLPLVA